MPEESPGRGRDIPAKPIPGNVTPPGPYEHRGAYVAPPWVTHPGRAAFVAEVRAAQGRTTYPTDAVVVA